MEKRKWYSLIDKIYEISNLEEAFQAVKKNKGAPRVDGVTIAKYEEKLEGNLRVLQQNEYVIDADLQSYFDTILYSGQHLNRC